MWLRVRETVGERDSGVRGGEEGESERGHAASAASAAAACFSLPAIFHPSVYVISVHFLPAVSTHAGVHILLFINAGRRLEQDGSGTKLVFWSGFFFLFSFIFLFFFFFLLSARYSVPRHRKTMKFTLGKRSRKCVA